MQHSRRVISPSRLENEIPDYPEVRKYSVRPLRCLHGGEAEAVGGVDPGGPEAVAEAVGGWEDGEAEVVRCRWRWKWGVSVNGGEEEAGK
jgi:hypothetical protein